MECPKWEELGLLFSANELPPEETAEYRKHLEVCESCRSEVAIYESERRRFYSTAMLCDAPSAAIDREILRVCSNPRRKAVVLPFFPAFVRKSFVPMTLFLMAFVTVGYIAFNVNNAKQLKSLAAQNQAAPAVQAVQPVPAVQAVAAAADSQNKPITPITTNFAATRGNLNDKGVITVDLKKQP
jgi:anti-sigma factor RsiW